MDKLKLYEKLGARKFQKLVFNVEKIKFKILKPFSKNIINYVDKSIDKKLEKLLKKDISEEKKAKLIAYFNREKLKVRIEFNSEHNRNYHVNFLDLKETLAYLNINKKIHVKGIKYNLVFSVLSITFMTLFGGVLIPIGTLILIYQLVSFIINFECVNLQNYNILRLESKLNKLEKIRERKMEKKISMYSEVSKVLGPLVTKSKGIPKSDEIVSSLDTLKELEEMKKLLDETIKNRENEGRKLKL